MTGGDAPVPDGDRSPFKRRAAQPWLHQVVPVSAHLPKYRRPALARDLAAGLTVGALAIPSAMAYAELVGVPAVNGLYVLLLPVVAYAAFGSSRQLSLGPEAGVAAMLGAGLVPFTGGDPARALPLAAVVALLVGACYAVARLFRLGWIADYFSVAVLIGYLHGIAVVLVVGQLGKLTGVTTGETETLPQLAHHLTHLGDIHALSAVLGGAALAIVLGLRRWSPRVPGSLIVLVAGIVISAAVDLASRGVAVVGPIPSGLPRFALPGATASDVLQMLPIAVGVFFVSFADSILTARAYAGKHNQSVDANQELLALGLANVAAGFTQGFTPSASGSRTAVNDQMGARTQLAGLFSVALAVAVLLFLTAPIEYLPSPLLGALIVAAAISLVTPARWKSLATAGRVPVVIAGFTTAAVILVGVLPALVAAVALSIIEVVARGARPNDAVLGFVPRLDRYGDVRFHRSA
ncbi:MAG: SulP family inorganic anion transporter, partial [Acidimicrobiales bacterium]